MAEDLDTDKIKDWRSIITLIVFIITNIIVLFPFHIPIYVPRPLFNGVLDALSTLRIIAPRQDRGHSDDNDDQNGKVKAYVRLNLPVNFVTAPLVADLFLLAILAIGRDEVRGGTLGADNIVPIDIMGFFLTLAYIAISIDASGLIRYLAFKVLDKGGKVGHRLFFYLYAFFFGLGSFIGNDPIILSGTAFLAYMTRVSRNIVHPRAWIYSQFAIANIASAILVSSNPTNLVLAGAFQIKFIHYTANMIVPVVITAIVLFPFLLYIIFADESLIPLSIKMHELSDEEKAKKPVNPNIPNARGNTEEQENDSVEDEQKLSLEEIMNPFLDKGGAAFGALIMAATLITLLAKNAASQNGDEHPVSWVTVPAAFVMFCWDIGFGWYHRHETREIARKGREEVELAQAERALREEKARREQSEATHSAKPQINHQNGTTSDRKEEITADITSVKPPNRASTGFSSEMSDGQSHTLASPLESSISTLVPRGDQVHNGPAGTSAMNTLDEKQEFSTAPPRQMSGATSSLEMDVEKRTYTDSRSQDVTSRNRAEKSTLVSLSRKAYRWSQETFPTVTAVVSHMPFALVPFAFAMFVLVQALVTKGWVPVFAYGWDHWVKKTGTVGAIGGMGFLSVILCNFAGTNIGTTILLSRVIQTWQQIHHDNGIAISNRTFWATVYSMAIGVNYGAFSTAFSASLAGLLWRDILARKHIRVRSLDFARVNLPIIAISMIVGCTILVGQVYITRDKSPYDDWHYTSDEII
ncbi:putative arsenite efflux transporter ArsB-like [Aspergillus clavatus NRRL 1]|uniref:Arsenite efflux transporter ArsB-like, puative n=1 Tax=Aspergillus clavatus (strain ATCC 1007 / CBS 513.65 / DSM 816 / NCTC 3887 / NRRL 1 / QM 1276 / 107) TaxID=344612 RepID=A1C734_ASPCL|nr:arsenite efflux transporter ArsB-like, putative [Aspergillus clavatus NRRL 1]EAW14205.1 arsenite efflux transporter ArsB-like, puative [Aspergillus clavatus NRRL 1]